MSYKGYWNSDEEGPGSVSHSPPQWSPRAEGVADDHRVITHSSPVYIAHPAELLRHIQFMKLQFIVLRYICLYTQEEEQFYTQEKRQ